MVLSSTSASIEQNILTTVHAMIKLFVPFCSAQDGESVDMTSLVFWAHCEKHKISTKHHIKKAFSPIWVFFIIIMKKLISLKCAVNSEWNEEITFIVSHSVVEVFEIIKIQLSMAWYPTNELLFATTIFSTNKKYAYDVVLGAFWSAFSDSASACAWSTKLGAWTHDWCTCVRVVWHTYNTFLVREEGTQTGHFTGQRELSQSPLRINISTHPNCLAEHTNLWKLCKTRTEDSIERKKKYMYKKVKSRSIHKNICIFKA